MRHAVRLVRRSPGFTALCVLTLGLSIGATTAIFSVVNPVLLRSLPYPDADRLVMVWERDADGAPSNTTFATYSDLVARARSIQRAAALGGWQPTLSEPGNAERVQGARVSWTYFRVLGVRPAIGRDFVEAEDNRSAELAVILSHGLWMRRYGGDRSIVGRAIPIDGAPHNVVGVLPPSFDNVLSPNAQIWRVLRYETSSPSACRTCRHLRMVARLRPEVTREQAAAELDRLSGVLMREHPRDYPAAGMHVVRLQEQVTRSLRPVLFAVVGATALVLLIAIANVTSLQLARAMRREGEFAVRSALGAGRGRLVQQLLAEGLLVATLGGLAGVLVAVGALPALLARLPQELPRLAAVRVDVAALGVAATITLVIGILIGLTPAWRGGRASVFDTLRGGTRVAGFPRHVARAGLVVAEIALALMLLAGAGLLSRSLLGLLAVDTGFQPANLLTLGVQATGNRYDSAAKVFAYHDRVRGAVLAVPGVIGVGLTSQLPLAGNMDTYGIRAKDKPLARPELAPYADRYTVSHDFMQTMRIPLLRGRYFTPADNRDSTPPVVIVSAALAAKIWPGEDAVGKQIQLGSPDSPWRAVVGVAANVRHSGLDATVTQQVYMPSRQWPFPDFWVTLVVRTRGDPASLAAAVRRAVRSIDPDQPITSVATMDQVIAASTAQRRLALLLFAAFAGVALLLAAAGIYGVIAGSVAERTREIGVRAALGATPGDILRMVLLQGARLAALGLAIGIAGALGFGRVLETLLYGIKPADPFTLGGVSVILAAIAGAACLVPARRALEVDPVTALRAD
jgi:putative ABC transport system permease protein